MNQLATLFSSDIPLDCHILKGRLETEGIPCFIYDENLIWVHPFKAVAIGGAKLKVPSDRLMQGRIIMELLSQGKLLDETGEYLVSETLENEINRQNSILRIKWQIRNDAALIDMPGIIESQLAGQADTMELLRAEKEFLELSEKKFRFTWKDFFYELFDYDRRFFKYFRTKPADYYIEKEIVENYIKQEESGQIIPCPQCDSGNTSYGVAIDFKWDVLYLILSLLTGPFFPIRKKYHCFSCGYDFKKGVPDARN